LKDPFQVGLAFSARAPLGEGLGRNLVFEHVRCHLRAEAEFLDRAEEIIGAALPGVAPTDEEEA